MKLIYLFFLTLAACTDEYNLDKMWDCKKCHTETKQSINAISVSGIVIGDIRTYQIEVCDEWDSVNLIERKYPRTNWSCHKK